MSPRPQRSFLIRNARQSTRIVLGLCVAWAFVWTASPATADKPSVSGRAVSAVGSFPDQPQWRSGHIRRDQQGNLTLDRRSGADRRLKQGPLLKAGLPKLPPVSGCPAGTAGRASIAAPKDIGRIVHEIAPKHGVDPNLVLAVIKVESNFQVRAVSPKAAQGLMQLIPATAERFGVRDSFKPRENIRGGVRYLRWLLDHFGGDLSLVLAGYNAGERAVKKHGGIPPYAETKAYVRKVMSLYGCGGGYGNAKFSKANFGVIGLKKGNKNSIAGTTGAFHNPNDMWSPRPSEKKRRVRDCDAGRGWSVFAGAPGARHQTCR